MCHQIAHPFLEVKEAFTLLVWAFSSPAGRWHMLQYDECFFNYCYGVRHQSLFPYSELHCSRLDRHISYLKFF